MSGTPTSPSQALLLGCPQCGQAFAEMLTLIRHRRVVSPGASPPKRPPRARRHEKSCGEEGQL